MAIFMFPRRASEAKQSRFLGFTIDPVYFALLKPNFHITALFLRWQT